MLNCCIMKHQQRVLSDKIQINPNSLLDFSNSQNKSNLQHNIPHRHAVSYTEFSESYSSTEISVRNPKQDQFSHNVLFENGSRNEAFPMNQNVASYKTIDVGESDSEDEFFEAEESLSKESSFSKLNEVEENSMNAKSYTFQKRDGVLEETSMKLLDTNEILCIPITQVF